MIRTIYISFLAIIFTCTEASSQCTFNINSTDGYTVNVTLRPRTVNATSPCFFGYTYTVGIDYTVSFTGRNIPSRLYTLQGNLGCTGSTNFFSLPRTPGNGTATTSNAWTLKNDCATASVSSLGCNTISLLISGPGINSQTLSCNYVVCNSGNNAPNLSVSSRSNICPASTINLSTITANNTPAGTVLEWHTSATPNAGTRVTNPAAVGVGTGTYYATFYDLTANCYSPVRNLSVSATACCNAGTSSPALNVSSLSNVCPATTANLSTVTASNTPAGTSLEWHTSATPSALTKITTTTAVIAGTYYATFYDATNRCYSPTRNLNVITTACCNAGTSSPTLNVSSLSNVCPATTANLSTVTASNTPAGTSLEWHTSATPSALTKITTTTAVIAGTYYATFYDATNGCYSPTRNLNVTVTACCNAGNNAPVLSTSAKVNVCPALTIDLSTISASNLPLGTVLEWHTSATPTALTKLNIVSSLSAGTYYATFHDLTFNCYSPTASVSASIVTCCNAGNEAPLLSAVSVSNVCPALSINLTGITASNTPSGTVLELHTSASPTSGTLVSAAASVNIGTYYATFHDLIFNCYSPTTAIEANSASCAVPPITSGNDGGLESDGCLAEAIAQRNYTRLKTPSVSAEGKAISYDNPRDLQLFIEPSKGGLQTRGENDLESFIPQKPFATATTSYITSPTDLIGITNAKKVVSVDYFDNTSKRRLAAILSTQTQDGVYNHTKVICDRLIGSNLLSTQKIEIDNKPFILSVLQRENGVVEYNINFSVNKENATTVLVTSQWSPEAYPAKPDYWNFQVWAESSTNAKKLALEILNKFKEQFPTLLSTVQPSVPKVFVKNGSYDNGILTLNIQNPIGATQITLSGNYTNSETQKRGALNKTISLSGTKEEVIEFNVGGIFDFGFTMKNNKAAEYDALYFADGAWGLDYNKQNSKVDNFEVKSTIPFGQSGVYTLERNPILRGTVKDYVSLFRSLRPASTEANMSGYQNLSFTASGNSVVEVTLVKKSITDWAKQYRAEVRLYNEKQEFALSLKDFSNGTNQPIEANDLVDVVFTIKGDGKTAKPFEISIENLVFDNKARQRIAVQEDALKAFPNPASELTELIFNLPERGLAQISLSNFQGKALILRTEELAKGNNRITIPVNNLPSGMYIATITTAKGKMTTKIVVP
jgi:Secretion system C-terminal sorting domain